MGLSIVLYAKTPELEDSWAAELRSTLKSILPIEIYSRSRGAKDVDKDIAKDIKNANVVFLHSESPNIDQVLSQVNSQNQVLFLVTPDGGSLPKLYEEGKVDECVVLPFRPIEVATKLKSVTKLLESRQLSELNRSLTSLLASLREDLIRTERLQKLKVPKRFSNLNGFKIDSRYIAGAASGGDYLDVIESKSNSGLGVLLSSVTSYKFSNYLLAAFSGLLDKASKEGGEALLEPLKFGETLFQEVKLNFGEKDL